MITSLSSGVSTASTATTTTTTTGSRADAAKAKQQAASDQKLSSAQAALTTLKAATDNKKSDPQKAAQAKQKLDALRKRLQALMLMSGGDPKAVARQAAQILKEIGQAAKDYADGTGGGSAGAATAAPATPAAPASPDPAGANADGTQATDGQDAAQDADAQMRAQAQAQAQNVVTSFSGPEAAARIKQPDDVIEGAKGMVASAKALIQAAKAKAKHDHKDGPEFQNAQDAMDQADKDLKEADKTLGTDDPFASGYTASGAPASSVDASPAVSVQA